MSNHLDERARRMQLLKELAEKERESFIRFAEESLGAYCGGDCDEMIDKMGDDQFRDTVKNLLEAWRRRRKRNQEELEELQTVAPYIC